MKITQLSVENHKRITAATVTPEGNMIVIGGENGEGKSSLIESIETLIRGKRAICKDPVHHGAEKAVIIGKFDNGLVVTKEISKDGKVKLIVKGENGLAKASPDTLLKSFYSEFSFDPDKFFTLEPQKRLEMLRKLVGIDFDELDAERKELYEARAQAGRDVAGRQSQIEMMPSYDGLPAREVSIGDMTAELTAAMDANSGFMESGRKLLQAKERVEDERAQVKKAEEAIAAWQINLTNAKAGFNAASEAAMRVEQADRELSQIDTAPIQAKIDALEDTNRKVRANINRREFQRSFASKKKEYERLTDDLTAIDAKKADMLSKAQFPIKGLSFGDDDVMYNGVTFKQASQAEKLRVVIAMNIALNPELRAICVRTASLLDVKNMKILSDLADEFDTQIWAERVGQGEECSVIIEDGQVKKPKKKE